MLGYRTDEFMAEVQANVRFSLPTLALDNGSRAVLFTDGRAPAPLMMRLLSGTLPLSGLPLPPEKGRVRSRTWSFDPGAIPIYLDSNLLYAVADRWRRVGAVFSDPDLNILGRTVREDYLNAVVGLRGSPPNASELAEELRPFGLGKLLDRRTEVLSGGEKQRLNCAVALLPGRRLFAGDFSTATLDASFRQFLISQALGFAAAGGITVLCGLSVEDATALMPTHVLEMTVDAESYRIRESGLALAAVPPTSEQAAALARQLVPREVGRICVQAVAVRRQALTQPITLELRRGEIVVLTGANGSGKTTFGRILTGRIPRNEVRGTLRMDEEVRAAIATQTPDEMILGRSLASELPSHDLRELIELGATTDSQLDPRGFSHGTKKLVGTANALRLSRQVAILDEPSSGLDWRQKQLLVRLLNNFPELAVLIITHDPALFGLGRNVDVVAELT